MENKAPAEKPLTLLERTERLEKTLQMVYSEFQESTQKYQNALSGIIEVIDAIIALQGNAFELRVQEEVTAQRTKRSEKKLEAAKNVLQSLVDSGAFVVAEVISKDSIIVGRELDKEGNVLGLGRVQVQLSQFSEEGQAFLLGKGIGAKYEGEKGFFEVTAVYDPAPPKVEAAPQATPESKTLAQVMVETVEATQAETQPAAQ
jgi:hypothetical protein